MKRSLLLFLSIFFCALQAFSQGYDGLIGRWTFNGNANDTSGNGLNGIVRGATLTTGMNGLPNTAYYFNGTDAYITVPYDSLMNTQAHSFCVLIKPMGFYAGNSQGNEIIMRGAEHTAEFSYQLEFFDNAYDNSDDIFSPTQDVFAGWTGGMTSNTPQTEWYYTPTIDSGTWYNVVLTYGGDTTKIYVNGVLKTNFYNPSNYINSTDSLNFGKSEDGDNYPFWLNGVVDEIRFYNRVLSPAEVAMFGDSLGNGKVLPIKFYLDANGDCQHQATEQYNNLPITVEIDSNGTPIDTVSATSGLYYYANGNEGDVYSFSVISSPSNIYVSCPLGNVLSDTLDTVFNATKYVGFSCGPSTAFDLQENLGVSTDLNAEVLSVLVSNNYCTPEPAVLTMNFSQKYAFGSAVPAPATVSGNTATWNLGPLSYLNSPTCVHITLSAAVSLTEGDTAITESFVTPIVGDTDTTNNNIVEIDTIRAAHDPNEMAVIPSGCIPATVTTPLQYNILFENTGNDTAFNIYVMDTLSDNLDARSLKIVAASNTMNVSKWYDNTYHNIYKFEFPNINLLDSSHHNQCEGMITFDINTIAGLAANATVFNHAGIFFDNNPVVLTNKVENMVGCTNLEIPTLVNSAQVQIYPNPAANELTVTNTQKISNIVILNPIGQIVFNGDYNSERVQVALTNMASGVYFIKVNNSIVRKFVKE